MRVLIVLGTRPEAVKLAPVVAALTAEPDTFDVRLCVTAQHRELLDPMLEGFGLVPDITLDALRPGQSLAALAGRLLSGLDDVIRDVAPDWIVVQGDTNTAMCGALAGHYLKRQVAHVEAGLRSHDRTQPFPEKTNRRIATLAADLHCAPTEAARAHLLHEGVADSAIVVTGNTVLDAVRGEIERLAAEGRTHPLVRELPRGTKLVVVTAHRRENVGEPLRNVASAIRSLAERRAGSVHFVLPVHLNPAVRAIVETELGTTAHVTLLPPQNYSDFTALLAASHFVLTDSGGVQEEAPYLGKPVLVLRQTTERPEGVAAGAAKLVGTAPHRIVRECLRLLDDDEAYRRMSEAPCPYGDGHAAERIRDALAKSRTPVGAPS